MGNLLNLNDMDSVLSWRQASSREEHLTFPSFLPRPSTTIVPQPFPAVKLWETHKTDNYVLSFIFR
eukprot:1120082-Prorocentrum_minimum.AAC.1